MVSTCIAASGVFAVARPNQGKAAKAPKRAGSKLWMPKSAAVDSPRIIVEGDKENKMAGLTELRKEVIMDMEDFAQNEVSAADTPPASIHAPRGDATPSIFSPTLTWPVGRRPESSSCKKMARGSRGVAASRVVDRRLRIAPSRRAQRYPIPAGRTRAVRASRHVRAPRARSPALESRLDENNFTPPDNKTDVIFFPPLPPAPQLMGLLKDPNTNWQPQDYLPDPESPDFLDQVADVQKRSKDLPDDHLVVLVGDMITEEALPTYMNMLNTLEGTSDKTGADASAWAQWTRKWTAEENRHGDLMNKYMWMTGKVSMKPIETTIQNLIGSGMNPKTDNNPYLGFVYTSFQERATKISHGNTARFAVEHGDDVLGKICGTIAADEGRHEIAYQRIIEEVMKRDKDGAVLAFADMMKKQIVMPAHLMDDGSHKERTGRDLFMDFASVADRTGTYTAYDYASIMDHLIKRWKIADLDGLSGDAAEAQEYLMKQPARIRRLADFAAAKAKKKEAQEEAFSWIFGRKVPIA